MSAACPRLGFELRLSVAAGVSAEERAALRSALRAEAHSRGLESAGGGADAWTLRVWREGGQAEHADREALVEWARARHETDRVEASAIVDLDDAE